MTAYPGLYEVMAQDSIRWIVIPCNDGMVVQIDREAAEAKPALMGKKGKSPKNGSSAKETPTPKPGENLSGGLHWGFMIIDKAGEHAWWLHGALGTVREEKRTRITLMWPAG